MDVRIGTWNLENLFRPGGDFGPMDDAVYRQKLDGLAATIEQMAPDGTWCVGRTEDPVAGKLLTVVCCHLKSKLLSFPGRGGTSRFTPHDEGERARFGGHALYRRTAEAVLVRGLADQLLVAGGMDGRQNAVVVLGDLNDEPDAATTQILYGPPGPQFDTRAFDVADTGVAMRLWNVARRLPEGERSKRRFQGRDEIIDHILISHVLLQATQEVRVVLQAGPRAATEHHRGPERAAPRCLPPTTGRSWPGSTCSRGGGLGWSRAAPRTPGKGERHG